MTDPSSFWVYEAICLSVCGFDALIAASTFAFSSAVKLFTSATSNLVSGSTPLCFSDNLPCFRRKRLPSERFPTVSSATIARVTCWPSLYWRFAATVPVCVTVAGDVAVAGVTVVILLSAAVPQVLCRTLFVAPAVFEPCLTTVFAILPLLSVNLVVKRSSSPA